MGEAEQIEGEKKAAEAQEVEAAAASVDAQQIEGERLVCSKSGCNKKPSKTGSGYCHAHGKRKRCEHQDCENYAPKRAFA